MMDGVRGLDFIGEHGRVQPKMGMFGFDLK